MKMVCHEESLRCCCGVPQPHVPRHWGHIRVTTLSSCPGTLSPAEASNVVDPTTGSNPGLLDKLLCSPLTSRQAQQKLGPSNHHLTFL